MKRLLLPLAIVALSLASVACTTLSAQEKTPAVGQSTTEPPVSIEMSCKVSEKPVEVPNKPSNKASENLIKDVFALGEQLSTAVKKPAPGSELGVVWQSPKIWYFGDNPAQRCTAQLPGYDCTCKAVPPAGPTAGTRFLPMPSSPPTPSK